MITTLYTSLMCALGIVSGILLQFFSSRQLVIIAGFVSSVGLLTCSFAPNSHFFLLGYGVILAFGGGLTIVPARMVLLQYFDKKRSLAIGLSMAGACVGGVVVPPLMERLEDRYGLDGTFLIFSALVLNCVPAAMTFFPRKEIQKSSKINEPIRTIASKVDAENNEISNGNSLDVQKQDNPAKRKCSCPLDLSVLLNYHFIAIAFSNCCCIVGFSAMNLSLPDFAINEFSEPVTRSQSALLLSGLSCGDLFGRIFMSLLNSKFNMKISFVVGVILVASLILTIASLPSYTLLFVAVTFYGVFTGTINITPNLLINECLPPETWQTAFAFITMFIAIPILSTAPLVATIRDLTGSYYYCFKVVGAINILAIIPWVLEYFLRRRLKLGTYAVNSTGKDSIAKRHDAIRASISLSM